MAISRRSLLAGSAAVGAGLAVSGVTPAFAKPKVRDNKEGKVFGDLVTDALTGVAIPAGFSISVVSEIGVTPLLDGPAGKVIGKTPSNLDGTGCFQQGNKLRLVRNHECRADSSVPVPLVPGTVYDAGAPMGGCTVIETDRYGKKTANGEWVGLSGTIRNCAGGQTPWGTWLSCEEDTTKAGTVVKDKAGKEYTTQKDHGYVFEVFPEAADKQIPLPIKAWGRAVFEGAAIGPQRHDAYITEDTKEGLFYRWVAPQGTVIKPGIAKQFGENDGELFAAQLVKNGKALVHYGELSADDLNKAYPVKWIAGGEDRQAQKSDLRKQFPGATVHPKIEGCWSDGQGLWFTMSYVSSSEAKKYGIDEDQGMVFFYDFKDETLTLKIYFEMGNKFDSPDNICVSPFGTITISEDGSDPNHLLSWTPGNGLQAITQDTQKRGEWAGPVWSPKGEVLFGSIQSTATYAVTGPFKKVLGGK